jgi:hypothetical protein
MFVFDVETLGVESTAVVLSAAMVHFDPEKRPTYQDLLDNACFVKFDVKEQLSVGRSSSKSTLEWWKTQHEYVRKVSLDPSREDMNVENGMQQFYDYMAKFTNAKQQTMWARGSLDQMVIDSLAVKFGLEEITGYNVWRDVRTAVDILYGTTNGYVEVVHPLFDRHNVIKHHPVHDCALDAMQLLYGKSVEHLSK